MSRATHPPAAPSSCGCDGWTGTGTYKPVQQVPLNNAHGSTSSFHYAEYKKVSARPMLVRPPTILISRLVPTILTAVRKEGTHSELNRELEYMNQKPHCFPPFSPYHSTTNCSINRDKRIEKMASSLPHHRPGSWGLPRSLYVFLGLRLLMIIWYIRGDA